MECKVESTKMNTFNQTSPLLQNAGFPAQRSNASYDNFAPSGIQAFGNQTRSSFGAQSFGNQQQWNGNHGYGQNQQQWNCGQNQFQGTNQQNQVDALLEVEQRVQQVQDALYQERQQGNNFQIIRQTADMIAATADMSRRIIEDIKQDVRNQQQYANSFMERQAYQQREQLLEQLAQVKDLICYNSQLRVNAQDNFQRDNLSQRLIDLARQAQFLARDIINNIQNYRNETQYNQNYNGQFGQNQGFRGNFQRSSPYNNYL